MLFLWTHWMSVLYIIQCILQHRGFRFITNKDFFAENKDLKSAFFNLLFCKYHLWKKKCGIPTASRKNPIYWENDFPFIENSVDILYIGVFFSNLEKVFVYTKKNKKNLYIEIFFQDLKIIFLDIEMSTLFFYYIFFSVLHDCV